MRRSYAFSLLLLLALSFRLLGSFGNTAWVNFQPLAALFFCAPLAMEHGKNARFSWLIPTLIWALTWFAPAWFAAPDHQLVFDPSLFLTTFASFGIVYALGLAFVEKSRVSFLTGSVLASVLFHLFTCSAAWIVDARYEKNAYGWWQANVSGLPTDWMPTWVFLRNFMVANFLFTASFLCISLLAARSKRHALAH